MTVRTYNVLNINSNHQLEMSESTLLSNSHIGKICICYLRHSTTAQKSLEEQKTFIVNHVKNTNYDYMIIFSCEGSGWRVNNLNNLKDFKRMSKFIPKLRGTLYPNIPLEIFIYDVSRFMRNVLVASKFINDIFDPNNCTIHSIIDNKIWNKDSKNRIDFLNELVSAESHSVLLSTKMKNNVKHRKKLGHDVGGVKFGYEFYRNKNNIMKKRKNQNEQNILGFIKKRYNNKSIYFKTSTFSKKRENLYKPICELLNSQHLLKRNKKWNSYMVHRIINSNELSDVKECELNITLKDNWIQCDYCDKWRKVTLEYSKKFNNNDFFECSDIPCMNCNIPEENYNGDDEMDICIPIQSKIEHELENLTI